MQKIAKGTCLSVIHNEFNEKKFSETAIIDNYDAAYYGSKMYYERAKRFIQINHPEFRLQRSLNKNNIMKTDEAILDTSHLDELSSLNKKIKMSPFIQLCVMKSASLMRSSIEYI